MKRVYVNEKWCLGCHLCEYHCAFADMNEKDMARALKNVKIKPKIKIEERDGVSFAVSCRHCQEPLCVKGCITGALTRVDGVVTINRDKCVNCYTCILICPYGAISSSDDGVVQKCELCIKTVVGTPACVRGCPNGAIVFEERQ
ncbi:MAG: 4Fe-4S binding protein [Nitrososphaerota archaeon]|jgi:carbon-monoxide dehydrogenase iron sulfur subunit|nr:4Fe-4S binding protein [Nitrososphaerota archaeon]